MVGERKVRGKEKEDSILLLPSLPGVLQAGGHSLRDRGSMFEVEYIESCDYHVTHGDVM